MVALVALRVAKDALPEYAHRFSPKKFTQGQLFACLVLKEFFRTDYRGIAAILFDCPDLQHALGLCQVPHFTTIQKAAARLLKKTPANRLLDATVRRAGRRAVKGRRRIELAAIDSTGFEAHHTSHYFVRRRAQGQNKWQNTTYRRFPKLALVADCSNHMVLAAIPGRGPGPDICHFEQALVEANRRGRLQNLLADAGYDAEWTHTLARDEMDIRTFIPAQIGRPTDKRPSGHYRAWMAAHLKQTRYGQRWQVETVASMIKRRLGSAVNARSYWSQSRALMLKAVAHNILILLRALRALYALVKRAFLQSRTGYFFNKVACPAL